MRNFTSIVFLFLVFSCGNEKVIQLPEINQTNITDVKDVSPAYIFYDESQPDSVELNRKNLIISTNWLVNVDKRLTLEQAIPKIVLLQNKKRDAKMHKNEAAKNLYTCHFKKINNLGFIDFTDIYYHEEPLEDYLEAQNITDCYVIDFNADNILFNKEAITVDQLKHLDSIKEKIFLKFDKTMNFQKYISYKQGLTDSPFLQINIDNDEFIY